MSTLETILTRAMNDPAFADVLLTDPEKALAEYELPPEVIAEFKNISRAEFEALKTEDRQSMSVVHAPVRRLGLDMVIKFPGTGTPPSTSP